MAAPSFPLLSDSDAAYGHLASFTRQCLPADLLYKEKCIFLQLWATEATTEVQRGWLQAHWAKQPFPTATATRAPPPVTEDSKEDNSPNSFLALLSARYDWFEVEKALQGLGQVFPGQLMGLRETILVPFK